MVTVPDVLRAMRPVIAAVSGINAVHYPAEKTIKRPLEVVLYWGGDTDTEIGMDMNQRMWQPVVRAQVLTPTRGNTPEEFARIDNILTPIVDVFDVKPASTLSGLVNRCQIVRVRPSLLIEYAGNQFFGAEIYWSIKFHRRAGG